MTAKIIINVAGEAPGTPGVAREFTFDKIKYTPPLVTLSVDDPSGISQWYWELLDQPPGATAVLSTPYASSTTFTPTAGIAGTYLVRCTFNGGEYTDRNATAWSTKNLALRIPAAGEELEYGTARGWDPALRKVIHTVDTGSETDQRKPAVIDIVNCTLVPPTEVTGNRYILDNTAGTVHANWDGAAKNDIVQFDGVAWIAETPAEGWVAYVDDREVDAIYIDDPTTGWILRPANVWTIGEGEDAIKRTNNLTGIASGDRSVNGGWGGYALADDSTIFGSDNSALVGAPFSFIPGGRYARAKWFGQMVRASAAIEEEGRSQNIIDVPLTAQTTNGEWTLLNPGNGAGSMPVDDDTFLLCDVLIGAKSYTIDEVKGWRLEFSVSNSNGTISIVSGSINKTVLSETNNGNESNWDVQVSVDAETDTIMLEVKGHSDDDIVWQGSLRAIEIGRVPS